MKPATASVDNDAFLNSPFGTMMINFLISKLLIRGCTEISLTVRETNVPAQLFLGSCGFEAKRVLRRFFEDTYEDGYRMVYQLPEKP